MPPAIYIHNGSFEDHTPDCFSISPEISNHEYPYYWTWGNAGASDLYYYVGCSFNDGYDPCEPPLPLPDGKAVLGIVDHGDRNYGQKTYIATCLSNPLIANKEYSFEFYIGFCSSQMSPSPHEFAIYGHPDCGSIPFADRADMGCPSNSDAWGGGFVKPGWIRLGSAIVSGNNNWVKARIDFAPPEDIKGFIFGPNCTNVGLGGEFFYYADKFSLTETSQLKFRTITADSTNCSSGVVLYAPQNINVRAYQWYKDSIAIAGATDSVYTVPANSTATGNYNVRIVFSNACLVSDPFYVDMSLLGNFNLGKDTLLCYEDSLILKPGIQNANYLWQDGSTADSLIVQQPGTYSVQISNQFGCTVNKSIHVDFQQCSTCPVFVPTAFTPNNDGKNDIFKVKSVCAQIDNFNLKIYDRWGQLVFESKDISKGWDGRYNGKLQPIATYVYFLSYKRHAVKDLERQTGLITLIR